MSFAMMGEVCAANGENSAEGTTDELEIEFVDSPEALDDDLEVISSEELPSSNALERRAVSEIVILDEEGYYDASEPNESPFDVKEVSANTNIVGNNLN